MTTETTKPSVITAAQFVADGYAAKVAGCGGRCNRQGYNRRTYHQNKGK